jgi:hypothetical protein
MEILGDSSMFICCEATGAAWTDAFSGQMRFSGNENGGAGWPTLYGLMTRSDAASCLARHWGECSLSPIGSWAGFASSKPFVPSHQIAAHLCTPISETFSEVKAWLDGNQIPKPQETRLPGGFSLHS